MRLKCRYNKTKIDCIKASEANFENLSNPHYPFHPKIELNKELGHITHKINNYEHYYVDRRQ